MKTLRICILIEDNEKSWLKEKSKQRTDSTHIISAIGTLNRLESVGEMLRAALNAIATLEPEWLQSWVPQAWYERYGKVAVTAFGLRQNRYRSLAKTRLQHLAIATAINLKRLWAWSQGIPHASTRTSSFASLNLPTI